MVNENLVNLINNKKPVEEVREIDNKYEIPSFEEFMKSYENDGNLNYDDLSGGDVGTPKVYGPGWWEYDKMQMHSWEKREKIHKDEKEERERKKNKGLCLKKFCWQSSKWKCGDDEFCDEHREEYEDGIKFARWMGKTVLGVGTSFLLGSGSSLAVGGAGWLGGKIGEAASTSKDTKEVWKSIGDFGWDLARGEAVGWFGGETVGKLASSRGGDFKRAYDATQIGITYGTPTGQFTAHEVHKANGVDYNPYCEICKQ